MQARVVDPPGNPWGRPVPGSRPPQVVASPHLSFLVSNGVIWVTGRAVGAGGPLVSFAGCNILRHFATPAVMGGSRPTSFVFVPNCSILFHRPAGGPGTGAHLERTRPRRNRGPVGANPRVPPITYCEGVRNTSSSGRILENCFPRYRPTGQPVMDRSKPVTTGHERCRGRGLAATRRLCGTERVTVPGRDRVSCVPGPLKCRGGCGE